MCLLLSLFPPVAKPLRSMASHRLLRRALHPLGAKARTRRFWPGSASHFPEEAFQEPPLSSQGRVPDAFPRSMADRILFGGSFFSLGLSQREVEFRSVTFRVIPSWGIGRENPK